MPEFLEVARKLCYEEPDSDFARWHGVVGNARARLQRALSKSMFDILNIETVFSALEMADVVGYLAGMPQEDIKEARASLLELIAGTLDRTQQHVVNYSTNSMIPIGASGPADYVAFANYAAGLLSHNRGHRLCVLTFNYDIGLEVALQSHQVPYSYCLDGALPDANTVAICKLHGSLNWARQHGPDSEAKIRWFDPLTELNHQCPFPEQNTSPGTRHGQKINSRVGRVRLVGSDSRDSLPFIVPPTDSKSEYRQLIKPVWSAASRLLSESDHISICGYSMPDTDIFFRLFYFVSMLSDTILHRVCVINTDPTTHIRFANLFAENLRRSPRSEMMVSTFNMYCDRLREECAKSGGKL